MREDDSRIRRGDAAENFAVLRNIALNLLKADTSFKADIKRKQERQDRVTINYPESLTGQGFS